jgi:hypothetical protein
MENKSSSNNNSFFLEKTIKIAQQYKIDKKNSLNFIKKKKKININII